MNRIAQVAAGILRFIRMVTLALHLMLAEEALPACYIERDNDPVALLDPGNLRAHLFHNPHRLMSDNVVIMHSRYFSVIDMQVRSANSGCGYADEDVILLLKPRIGDLLHFNFLLSLISHCLHGIGHSF